jgi:ribosomal-protein-alanine N-acetyltransferase
MSMGDLDITYIHTERMNLRVVDPELIGTAHRTLHGPALAAFYGTEQLDALALMVERFEKGLVTFNKSFLYMHLIHKDSKEVIGWCGYHTYYTDHDRAELGYVMEKEAYMGKGLMTEALEKVLEYGFHTMGLNRVEAFVGADNRPSLRLLEKFGFQKEGVLKGHYLVNGVYEDSWLFSLLKEKYST